MRAEQRAARMMRLLEYVNEQDRPVPVSELIQVAGSEFGVTEVTLRSDLAALCQLRSLRKLARGAYEAAPPDLEGGGQGAGARTLFATRLLTRAAEKIAIGRQVAALLATQPDLQVLLLDAGSTTYYVADQLAEHPRLDLMAWTPSVAAANRLAEGRGISVRLLGGEYHADYGAVSGDETARALRALAGAPAADAAGLEGPVPQFQGAHCVLDVNYISPEGGLFTDESRERVQKRLMAELAEDLTIVADRTKLFNARFGLQAHEVFHLQEARGKRHVRLVTDLGVGAEQSEQLRAMLAETLATEIERSEEQESLMFTGMPGEGVVLGSTENQGGS
jgi:DeoR/GlpR family transcriptional regulator of sugar metabolism